MTISRRRFWALALAMTIGWLMLAGCQTVERYQAMQAATTAPASVTDGDVELAIDAYVWRDENANEAEGYLQVWIVAFDRNRQPIDQKYRVVECQVIRCDPLSMAGAIGRYPLGTEQSTDRLQMIQPPPTNGQLCWRLKHDLATTGLSPNYDLTLILENPSTQKRWTLRTGRQPVHRLAPPTDWFEQATSTAARPTETHEKNAR